MNASCHIWMSHVGYEWEWEMSHMNESCQIRMREWETSHMNESCQIRMRMRYVTYEWIMSDTNERMRDVTYEWVMSNTNENEICNVWMNHVRYEWEWDMSRMNKAHDITHTCKPTHTHKVRLKTLLIHCNWWMSYVICKRVMSHMRHFPIIVGPRHHSIKRTHATTYVTTHAHKLGHPQHYSIILDECVRRVWIIDIWIHNTWMFHVTYAYMTHECFMPHLNPLHTNVSCHIWILDTWMRHVTYEYITHECVMSHMHTWLMNAFCHLRILDTWMSHVSHMNESWHMQMNPDKWYLIYTGASSQMTSTLIVALA